MSNVNKMENRKKGQAENVQIKKGRYRRKMGSYIRNLEIFFFSLNKLAGFLAQGPEDNNEDDGDSYFTVYVEVSGFVLLPVFPRLCYYCYCNLLNLNTDAPLALTLPTKS